jgi:hypothetical protein
VVIMWGGGGRSVRMFGADKENHCNSVRRLTGFRDENQIWTPIMRSWCVMLFIHDVLPHRITR